VPSDEVETNTLQHRLDNTVLTDYKLKYFNSIVNSYYEFRRSLTINQNITNHTTKGAMVDFQEQLRQYRQQKQRREILDIIKIRFRKFLMMGTGAEESKGRDYTTTIDDKV